MYNICTTTIVIICDTFFNEGKTLQELQNDTQYILVFIYTLRPKLSPFGMFKLYLRATQYFFT